MPIRFSQGDIKRLLIHLKMKPFKKGSNIYGGIGPDGKMRTCKFDYHKNRDIVASGTAKVIARSLLFSDCMGMKEYMDKKL